MNRLGLVVLAAAALCAAAFPLAAQEAAADPLAGTWVGELNAGRVTLRIVFTIASSGGVRSATMDSPDQGARGIPVSAVKADGRNVVLEVKAAGGAYSGTLAPDGTRIDGEWTQAGRSFPVALQRSAQPIAVDRPQEPKPPFPYTSREVTIPGKAPGVELAGTLTIPPGPGPFPAVVLVTGSGPQNRDEELMGHKPFLVIADYLARNGIEVLRCDDRGVGQSRGDFGSSTTMDFADDAEAAFTFLAAQPGVDRSRVGIAGHSEGGLIAPIVAARNPAVAFIVMMAGPGIRGDRLLLMQAAAIARASGTDENHIAAFGDLNRMLYDLARSETDPAALVAGGRRDVDDFLAKDTRLSDADKAELRKNLGTAMGQLATPWTRTFLSLDPADYLSRVHVPVLALAGSKDLQVPADANLEAIRAALAAAENTRARTLRLEGLNHLFQHAGTGLPAEYGRLTETFAPEALAAIREFIVSLR